MPNWKKVIVSGSDASLNSLYVKNAVTASVFSGSFTGSLFGTASFAVTSSYITASNVFGPYGSNSVTTSSYALVATTSSFSVTSSYITGYTNNGIEDYVPIWQNSGSLAKSIIFQKGNNTIGINRINATSTLDVLSNGGGNTIANFETQADPDVYIQLKNNVGYGYIGVNNRDFWFQPGGFTKAVLSASGEFGLGTLTPKYTLDVVGTGNFSSNLTASGSVKFPGLTSANQTAVVGINTTTGQLFYQTTSSLVVATASFALNATSASYALTASYAENITVSGSIINVDYIDFDTNVAYTLAEGRLGWDSGEGTLQLGLEGGNVQYALGEQLYQYVYNAESTTLTKGQVVYVSGSQGNKIAVKLASDIGDPSSAGTLGLVAETITAGGNGWVITEGTLRKLNTVGLTAGALLYLSSTPGAYTQTIPTAPSHSVRLGYVERVHASVGSIYVKIDNGYELGELHDVVDNTTTSSYGDLLVKSGSVWINSKQLTGSYGLTGSLNVINGGITGSLQGTSSFAIQSITSSYADSFTVKNNAVISGSLTILQNLTVFGSASITYVSESTLNIGTNLITVNTNTPAIRFGGLAVIDSGSMPQVSGSWLFDSQQNRWIFVHQQTAGGAVTSSIGIMGPETYNNIGNETQITLNRLTKGYSGASGEHIGDSQISDDGTTVTIPGILNVTTSITGSLFGTSSFATLAATASFVTASNVFGPYGSNSIVTSSYAVTSTSASYAATASYSDAFIIGPTLTKYATVASSIAGSNTVFTQATGSYTSAFFKYTVSNSTNARSGDVMVVWNGTSVQSTDNSTLDIGSTTAVTASATISGANVLFNIQTNTSGWTIKSLGTFM